MIDDSAEDALFVERGLRATGLEVCFRHVLDGREALDYLRAKGQFAKRKEFPFPNVVLCDLKMPGMDGFDFLEWLQKHPACKVIPTIVFSSSDDEGDIHRSYVLGANAYLVKPHDLRELTDIIKVLHTFWVRCEVPRPPPEEICD